MLTLTSAQAAPVATAPIEVHDGHVYVRVSLAGAPTLWFLVDSGAAAPVNLIAKTTADRLGLKGSGEQQAGAIGGSVKLTFTPPLALRIGGADLPADRLAIIPLGDSEDQEGHAVDGILGYAFFQAFNPEIDYPHHRMRLGSSPTARRGAGVTPLRIVDKNCVIDAEIVLAPGDAPTPVKLVVDTGYDGGLLLTSPFVIKHDLLKSAGAAASGASVGGATTRRPLMVPRLTIGRLTERRVAAALSTDQQGAFASSDVDGYIGGDFLKHYIVFFDYAHGRFALTPPSGRGRAP
jgi:hypothetical protein